MANYTLVTPTSRLDTKDEKILRVISTDTPIKYGDSINTYDVVQMHVYDADNNLIVSVRNLREVDGHNYSFDTTGETENQTTTFYTDVDKDVKNLGLLSGTYIVVYNFFKYYLSFTPEVPWYIQDISTSRRELRVITSANDVVGMKVNGTAAPITKTSLTPAVARLQRDNPRGTFLLDFLKNDVGVVINQTVSGNALLFKLYKPLPDTIEEKAEVVPMFEVANPVKVYITVMVPGDTESPTKVLGGPNTNVFASQYYETGTAFQSWNDLLSTSPQTSRDLLDHFINSNNYKETVNVDYSNYANFVHFGSAEEQVRNFQYKMQLLEQYNITINSMSLSLASGSVPVQQSINHFSDLKSTLLNGLSGYENWLYWESGSTFTSTLGFGQVTQSTWPKSTSAYPYTLYSVASSPAVAWFNNQVGIANDFDRNNAHNLLRTVPFHLREDEVNNESYLTFLQMVGQHYDVLWTYATGMTKRYEHQHKLTEGAPKDVIWDTMKSFGMDLTNGNDVASLWKYAFGTDVTGSFNTTNILSGLSGFENLSSADATKEIWKRLFNNLPYLLKSKGSVRGIKALITCYGIPSTILRVKEYGGPEPDYAFETSKYIADEFTYTLDFDGQQIVSQSWFSPKPNSIEFRFMVNPTERNRMMLVEGYTAATKATNFKLSIAPTYSTYSQSNYVALPEEIKARSARDTVSSSYDINTYVTMSGYFVFEVSGGGSAQSAVSNEMPIYDSAYWSVLLERTQPTSSGTYNLWAKQALDGRIVHEASFSVTLTGTPKNTWDGANVFAIGSSSVGGSAFTGNMQEFRLWSSTLNEDVFDNHVRAPLAYNGNTYSSSYYDLVLRWRMNNAEWYTSGVYNTLLLDSNPTQTSLHHGYWSGSAAASASVIASLSETNYYESPGIGFRRMSSNKVRVDSFVSKSGELDSTRRVTVSRYDRAPLDSNKVGIFLAPTEIINEDIIRTFAGLSYDNFIGNPLDVAKDTYFDLNQLNTFYWLKYGTNPNIFTYMRVLSYFDKSLYGQIRKMLPARVDANIGLLFEPHMLERSKVITIGPVVAMNAHYTTSIDIDAVRDLSFIMTRLEASGTLISFSPFADYETLITSQSLVVVPLTNPYSYPILDMSISNGTLTLISGSFTWSATGSIVNPACDFWLNSSSYMPITASGAVTGYNRAHFIFHRQRFTSLENLWYDGCLQTIDTTPDKGLPFEIFDVAPNILTVIDASSDKPQLKVE